MHVFAFADRVSRDVFLRELISNANDALEKLRLVSLTDKSYQIPDTPLNITIKLVRDADGPGGRVIIAGGSPTFIVGMSELTRFL